MDEIKFHDSVADRFREVAVDITHNEHDPGDADHLWPTIEGVKVVGHFQEGVNDRRMIIWYEGRYLDSPFTYHHGWEDTTLELDETFVVFRPTKPRKITRYIWE